MTPVDLPREGVVYSWTVVRVAPAGFSTPYALSYVDLPGGVRVLAQIDAEATDLRAGLRVVVRIGPVRHESDGTVVEGPRFEAVAA
ncbi:MAG TPA: OB-fold domain-containing protein [Acidimicrobiales bacterium]